MSYALVAMVVPSSCPVLMCGRGYTATPCRLGGIAAAVAFVLTYRLARELKRRDAVE